ncbi:endolytic transglycosylase MltG [Nitrospina watsonii]|uniref:Endolytic murein transglycosylase n=1 Tax=Nitrospina watsonii TaxID=1323948 RepID=A0ABM9HDC8_9BACT|nr:endolytic transglycosylase MltG [Nitrospina watsonii]CAI2718112.1 Endolytic murein transglycosylase [Nitrospina watsonii]
MKRYLKTSLLAGLLLLLVGGFLFSFWLHSYSTSPLSTSASPAIIEIERGKTLKQVSHQLNDRNLIGNPSGFVLFAYLNGKQNQIRAGEYRLSGTMPPKQILETITSGHSILYTLTVPEGYRILEIAGLVEAAGLGSRERFVAETQNRDLIQTVDAKTEDLEGYLFPETYKFPKNAGEHRIVETMVQTFRDRAYRDTYRQRAEAMNLSFHEVVTLASIIEKETGAPSERQIISSVFHNRLKLNMRLQTDPTVIYALADFDGNIRKKDLSVESPYNTYLYPGLPPGPIANPGLDSIEAALDPADTDYLYFVSRQDGTHKFSTNLNDHNKAVVKYQLQGG